MKAELSKGAEVIRFVWPHDIAPHKIKTIQVLRFNLAFSEYHYYENKMGLESARAYWDNLVQCGFRQMVTCVRI